MYSVEWQKRGLPHIHILLRLKDKLKPNQIDNIISAEIPDLSSDKESYDIIVKNLMHGPCGPHNAHAPRMKDGKCSKQFPRKLQKETIHNENGYPQYRSRSPADGGQTATIKLRNGNYANVGNSLVVPYSSILTKMLNAHINVEACSSSGRYVSSNESAWRLLGFPLHERHPTVTHLAVHLENGERVYFDEINLSDIVSTPPKTTLTTFFELCRKVDFAKRNTPTRKWRLRIQGTPVQNWPGVKSGDALDRVYTVHTSNMECFCLRMLFYHVRGPTSFSGLKRHNHQELSTFREACEKKRTDRE
ncbi:hypothetical protein AVEN_129971-1 [Araneus ventricosus]|uniref:Helitron helicase-like domain-containing protein n=1 Tax=Araneus ventricosus TaxID=182803 RepID=A0A4Y2F7U4_ARAVE|nr:hypothetical protein AVEN_129971-1 [Araneus ventricosus]